MFAKAGQGCLPCGGRIVYQDNIKDHYGEPPDQGQLGKLNMWPMPQYPATSHRGPHMLFMSPTSFCVKRQDDKKTRRQVNKEKSRQKSVNSVKSFSIVKSAKFSKRNVKSTKIGRNKYIKCQQQQLFFGKTLSRL